MFVPCLDAVQLILREKCVQGRKIIMRKLVGGKKYTNLKVEESSVYFIKIQLPYKVQMSIKSMSLNKIYSDISRNIIWPHFC